MDAAVPTASSPRGAAPARPGLAQAPFRFFFLLAAVDAMLGVAMWLPLSAWAPYHSDFFGGAWHRNALLFGTMPAVLAGFLLTALPRWTGRAPVPARTVAPLAATWLAARAASLASPPWGMAITAAFLMALTLLAALPVLAAPDRRNVKVVALLACLAAGAVLTAAGWHAEAAWRVALAALVALIAIIGGRVTPALTSAFILGAGGSPAMPISRRIEHASAAAAASALIAWVAAPEAWPTAMLCAAAATAHLLRLAQWKGRRGLPASIMALHVGYGWIAAGFALAAIGIAAPSILGPLAGIHAWTAGAAGTMALAVMASMIRKHSRRPFSESRAATAAFLLVTLSALARVLAEAPVAGPMAWMTVSAAAWIGAFACFLAAFGRLLLLGVAAPGAQPQV